MPPPALKALYSGKEVNKKKCYILSLDLHKVAGIVKSIKTAGCRQSGVMANRYRISFSGDGNVLEWDCSGSCTTLWIYWKPVNCMCMVCELHVKHVVIKNTRRRQSHSEDRGWLWDPWTSAPLAARPTHRTPGALEAPDDLENEKPNTRICPPTRAQPLAPVKLWKLAHSGSHSSFLLAQMVKNPPAMQKTRDGSLGPEDPVEKGMATHSRILAWRSPWTEEPSGLQSTGSRRDTTKWLTKLFFPRKDKLPDRVSNLRPISHKILILFYCASDPLFHARKCHIRMGRGMKPAGPEGLLV